MPLNIAGVALDTSVLSIKHHTVDQVEENKTDHSFYQIRSDGIYFNSAVETTLSLYSIEGRLMLSSSFYGDHLNWGPSFPTGIYIIRIKHEKQIYTEKVIIAK